MEFVIGYIIIAVILSMLTSSLFFIIFAVISLFILFVAALSLYFLYMLTKLFASRSANGRFVRIDTVKNIRSKKLKDLKYKVAVYSVEDKECESVFPAEGAFGIYFYRRSGNTKLWYNEKEGKVFDKYNIASCIIWPVFCIILCLGAAYCLKILFGLRGFI